MPASPSYGSSFEKSSDLFSQHLTVFDGDFHPGNIHAGGQTKNLRAGFNLVGVAIQAGLHRHYRQIGNIISHAGNVDRYFSFWGRYIYYESAFEPELCGSAPE